jgi:hypothetical protein
MRNIMKGTSGMAKDVVKAFINSKMVINIGASGLMASDRVKVTLYGKVVRFIRVYFLMILCTERECLFLRGEAGSKKFRLLCKKES